MPPSPVILSGAKDLGNATVRWEILRGPFIRLRASAQENTTPREFLSLIAGSGPEKRSWSRCSASRRRGAIAVVVLVCLVVGTLICGSLIRVGMTQRHQVRLEERRLQAEWLAESGLERASAFLNADPNYAGDTWTVSFGANQGVVRITIEAPEDRPDHRRINVQADYPHATDHRARFSKTIDLSLTTELSGEPS